MLFFYLRHGDPIYNPDSLTPLGKRQAEALGHRLSVHGLDKIYVSTSQRAKDTARPTCEMLHKEPIELDWTNEHHAWEDFAMPDKNGREQWPIAIEHYANLFATEEIRKLGENWGTHPDLKGTKLETAPIRISKQTDDFLEGLGYRHDRTLGGYICTKINTQRIALFAHWGFGMAFLSTILDIPYPQFCTHFDLGLSSMTVLHFPEKTGLVIPRVVTLSNDSHLYRESLPTFHQNGLPI